MPFMIEGSVSISSRGGLRLISNTSMYHVKSTEFAVRAKRSRQTRVRIWVQLRHSVDSVEKHDRADIFHHSLVIGTALTFDMPAPLWVRNRHGSLASAYLARPAFCPQSVH